MGEKVLAHQSLDLSSVPHASLSNLLLRHHRTIHTIRTSDYGVWKRRSESILTMEDPDHVRLMKSRV